MLFGNISQTGSGVAMVVLGILTLSGPADEVFLIYT